MTTDAAGGGETALAHSVSLTDRGVPVLELAGDGVGPARVSLVGHRLTLSAPTEPTDGEVPGSGWRASIRLVASRWGGAELPPPAGAYRLSVGVEGDLPAEQLVEGHSRVSFERNGADVSVMFAAPLADDEVGAANQARLEAQYRAVDPSPENAVFFESFYGQNVSCNPRAIARELARVRPDVTRYWGVADLSVQVPEGAVAVLEGSAEWWRVRAAVRLIVINDWLRGRYRARRHQVVLQTWHGTMLKRLALSRRRLGLRPALATLKERARWTVLLAQNAYAAGVFRRSYAWFGPVWEVGYPRDDALVRGNAEGARERLGVPSGARVVLYAPTWRDDRPDHVDHLDAARFAQLLGDDHVVLVRGHSRTLRPGEDVRGGGVIDVTSYPDISDLFLVADALVTDYSSVMFDFTVTGKPIFFHTPDLERYRSELRGFYFDLLDVAPGPVVRNASELAELVRDPESVATRYADRYRAWRERFNPHDDGHAAERVVARILTEGFLH